MFEGIIEVDSTISAGMELMNAANAIAAAPYEVFMSVAGMMFDTFHYFHPEYDAVECAETVARLCREVNAAEGVFEP